MNTNYLKIGVAVALTSILVTACEKTTEDAKPTVTTEPAFMASTTASNRVALLEDFTGVRCTFCPDGHVKAVEAQDELGKDKFIIMAVHAGQYATPAAGWANFTNIWGEAIRLQSNLSGYPAGTISRVKAADLGVTPQNGGTAMSRSFWKTAAQAVLAMPSPVNVGAMAEYNSSTKELTVNVDAYYTADETAANNINVAFLQSKLMSKQSGDPTSGDLYEQNHVLRNLLTGQWGDVVTETKTTGTKVRKTYTYPVPADYNGTAVEGGGAVVIENCSVVVFISRGKTDVLTAVEIPITVK